MRAEQSVNIGGEEQNLLVTDASMQFVVCPSWTASRIAIIGLPRTLVDRLTHSILLKDSIPGLHIDFSLANTGANPFREEWSVLCVRGAPGVSYNKRLKRIIYRYEDINCVELDLVNLTLQILELYADAQDDLLLLHCSIVSHKVGSVLLFGAPLAGKTTVAVQAIIAGWRSTAGEHAVVNVKSLRILSGTSLHNIDEHVVKRFFPSLRPGYLSVEEIGGNLLADASLIPRIGIMMVPKVTDGGRRRKLYVLRLSENMAFRILNMDVGTYAHGTFFLHYSNIRKSPAHSLDNIRRRTERARRITDLCRKVPTFFIEGHPLDIIEWLYKYDTK